MSDYERHKGTLVKVDTDLTKGQFVSKLIEDYEIKVPAYYDLTVEQDFQYFCSGTIADDYEYYFSDKGIYKIDNTECDSDDDIFEYSKNEKGEVEYQFQFYNGGTCLSEQVDELIEKIEKDG